MAVSHYRASMSAIFLKKEGSRAIKKSVALTDEDIQTVRRLTDNGVTITAQMIPSEPNEAILTFIK